MLKNDRYDLYGTNNATLLLVGRATGGGGASNMTGLVGMRGVTSITYNAATGVYFVNFTDVPAGTFLGCWGSGNCSTPTAAKQKTVAYTKGSYDSANKRFQITLVNGSGALADLATDEEITLIIAFSESAKL